ncbi:hypothetical protein PTSG_07731 [Salpingoeca rosetta]|uniref:protein-serine/threonine phosphatase n=1 Tax=Salpingoeca rosetta (strain ATCC 50818 / BSB-021) TaxID=946362 RepID=F2UHL8_SALR5|nr:uncharacterized protein PTSG_07731 [Salpingoeca rosetta]EGD76617.1 hypothetical protein PTSG_07731 [Salpingoeca rosetta]|eukprot:XP_004991531.1 hypothetical protein PTSG_07731 [Salpingoeca rosetta]
MGAFRSKPAVEKDIEAGVDQHGRSFICGSMQGWRIDQEDAHLIVTKEKQYAMYGVFDGHGGPEVSALVARRLLEFLKSHPEWDRNKEEAVRGAFRNMDKFINSRKGRREMRTLLQLTPDAVAPMEEGELDLLQRDASRPIEELVEEELMRHREEPSGDSLAATQSTQSTQALSSAEGSDDDETQASDPEEKISNNGKGGEKETESNKNDDVTAGGGGGGGGEQPAKRAKRMGTANTKEKEQGDGDSMKTGDDDDGDDDDDSDDDNDDDNDDEYVPASARNKTHGDNDDDDSSSSDEGEQTRDSATSSQEETEGKTPIMNDDDDDDDDADASGVKDAAEAAADELFASTESGFSSGTTANLVIMDKAHLLVANIGDCRAVVCSGGRAVELSVDHKPTDEPELSRITRAGSRVTPNGRIDGGLNLSRALGDWRYKRSRAVSHEDQAVSYVPDFQTRDIKDDDEFLIVACDGIWNTMESQEAVDFVRERLCNGTPLRQLITEVGAIVSVSRFCQKQSKKQTVARRS